MPEDGYCVHYLGKDPELQELYNNGEDHSEFFEKDVDSFGTAWNEEEGKDLKMLAEDWLNDDG